MTATAILLIILLAATPMQCTCRLHIVPARVLGRNRHLS